MRGAQVAFFVLAIMASTGMPAAAAGGASCGGTLRWPVKVGTDASATQVDLSNVKTATVAAMRALPAPATRPTSQRANATELTVFSIDAVLVQYNQEPDHDYHLVIQDPSKVRMIVEIPDPACFQGTSHFASQIAAARQAMQAVFTPKTKAQQAGLVPVRVTGVGFFDEKDHGTGGTPNGIELHPVLSIEFRPGAVPPPVVVTSTSGQQLLRDPGFEGGASGSAWRASADVITSDKQQHAHAGHFYAWLGGTGRAHTDTLSQQVSVPATASHATLSYWLDIETEEKASHGSLEQNEAFDTLVVEVRGSGGSSDQLADYSNLDAHNVYEHVSLDLTAYRGQTVTIVFAAKEDKSKITSFFVDDVTVDIQ